MRARLGEVVPALEECRKTIVLLQGITEDATNMRQRLNRAETHQYLADAYLALAASPTVSASESRQHMSAARDMFQQTLDILNDSRSRGGDLGIDEEVGQTNRGRDRQMRHGFSQINAARWIERGVYPSEVERGPLDAARRARPSQDNV